MEKIETIKQLSEFQDRLAEVKKKTPHDAAINFWDNLLVDRWKRKCDALCAENNKKYASSLPESVEVGGEIAKTLAGIQAAYEIKQQTIDGKLDGRMMGIISSHISAIVFPTVHSVGSALYRHVKLLNDMENKRSSSMALRTERETEILGSYLLTEPEPGKFILKRGSWTTVLDDCAPMHPRGAEYIQYRAQMDNVGLASTLNFNDLLPAALHFKPTKNGRGR